VSSCALYLLIWGVILQSVYESKIDDIDDLRKRLMKTCFDFDQKIIDAGDHVRSCVHAGGGHFEHMNVHLYNSTEHLMKLSM